MEDWIINNGNVLGLDENNLCFFTAIQYEIITQIRVINVNYLDEFLHSYINVKKVITGVHNLSITDVMRVDLGFNNFNISNINEVQNNLIQNFLLIKLSELYSNNEYKNFLTLEKYTSLYNDYLNEFLSLNIDADENDFIKNEISICEKLLKELDKPIYNIGYLISNDSPCNFKVWLSNSISKRVKFLKEKYINKSKYNSEIFLSERGEKLYKFLNNNYLTNKSINKSLYIYRYLIKSGYINISQKRFEIYIFGSYKNLRESNKLIGSDENLILKELEREFDLIG